MSLGSFTLDNKRITIECGYSHVDGVIYKLIESNRQVAVTTYRGLQLAEGVPFSKDDLQDGLRAVLRRSTR